MNVVIDTIKDMVNSFVEMTSSTLRFLEKTWKTTWGKIALFIVLVIIVAVCVFIGLNWGAHDRTTANDTEFLSWMKADVVYQTGTTENVYNEAISNAWSDLEVAAEEAEDYVRTTSIPKCDSFTVLNKYTALRDEYHEYLSDKGLYFSNMKSFAIHMLDGQSEEASVALDNANDYAERVDTHMARLVELTKSPSQENP